MRVTLVSQYYPPEVGATQNRMASFVDGLVARGHHVTVVCEQPNHPAGVFAPGFGGAPVMTERGDGVVIHRLWVATSPKKTPARRMALYGTFAGGATLALALTPRPDVVVATSPPLPVALTIGLETRVRKIPFVLDVRDLWPAAAEALGELSNPRVLRAFEAAERWLYRRASRVTATTKPFCVHIDRVAGRPVSVHLPNGTLDELLELPETPRDDGPFVVGYVGNLGLAQGLSIILDAAQELRGDDVRFVVVGEGALAAGLREERDRRGLDNVEFRDPVPVTEVGAVLSSCDALLVPLRDHALLDDFIPSKLYDAMAVGRPVIVAARGEAAALVRDANAGLVIAPEDGPALAAAVRALAADRDRARALGANGRRAARGHTRSRQVGRLEQVLLEAAGRETPTVEYDDPASAERVPAEAG